MIQLLKSAKLLMAALSIGSHYSPSYQFKKRSFHTPSVYSLPSLGSSLCRIKGPRLIRNGVLARAEDKAGGSSSPSLPRQQGVESKNEKQLELMKTSMLDFEAAYQPKTDLTGTLAINLSWVTDNQDIAMALLFAIGHAGIIFEESLAFNKSAVGLLMAVNLWVVRSSKHWGAVVVIAVNAGGAWTPIGSNAMDGQIPILQTMKVYFLHERRQAGKVSF